MSGQTTGLMTNSDCSSTNPWVGSLDRPILVVLACIGVQSIAPHELTHAAGVEFAV